MSWILIARSAVVSLARHRLRSLLTTLGIAVGIAAVVCTVALGEGSAAEIHQQFLNLGDNFIWIENGNRNVHGVRTGSGGWQKLTAEDAAAIVTEVPEVSRCSPNVDGRIQLINGNLNWNTRYRAVSPAYLLIKAWPVALGAPFTEEDVRARARVAILGQTVADQLFPDENPIGQTFRAGPLEFTTVGVLQARGTASTGEDQDDTIFLPYTTAQHYMKGDPHRVDDVMCSATSTAAIGPAQDAIATLLRARHRLSDDEPDDFNLRDPGEVIERQEASAQTMELMISAVASVSLLVGGVGVMNIMLVSVTERTREIGLRMSLGARPIDVQLQFLAEAIALGLAGGAAGVLLAAAGAAVFRHSLGLPMTIAPGVVAIATAFAATVGLVFGYYPARHASQLDPIDALRVE